MTNEARAAVANNNQAGLFVSMHAGFSLDKMASGSSIYVMTPEFTGGYSQFDSNRLFFPWYMAYRGSRSGSSALASQLQQSLRQSFPGLKFPIRSGPLGVLTSATMPAVAIEIGNLNNETNAKTLTDEEYQTKVANGIAAGIERFASVLAGAKEP